MAPIRSTKFGFNSSFADKVETDNNFIGIRETNTADDAFEPGNGYRYLVFTSPGNLYVNKSGRVDIVAVGGGGAGGTGQKRPSPVAYYGAGGGGAGGLYEIMGFNLPIGDYEISIGAGGATPGPENNFNVQPGTNRNGSPGTPTYISGPGITTITAYGGGGGGGSLDGPPFANPAGRGSDGGSGGGSSSGGLAGIGNRTTATAPATGNPIPSYLQGHGRVQGHSGYLSASSNVSGGGGGAGGAARFLADGTISTQNARGGDGRSVWGDDVGITTFYGTPGPTPGRYFAGGGGAAIAAAGGAGGGGTGADDQPSVVSDGTAGTVNTGGGGGGGHGFRGGYAGGPGNWPFCSF